LTWLVGVGVGVGVEHCAEGVTHVGWFGTVGAVGAIAARYEVGTRIGGIGTGPWADGKTPG
jgi:hypothetical protein